MHATTLIRTLIWLAALGTAMSRPARELAWDEQAASANSERTLTVSQGLPGEVVLGTTRVEQSSQRCAEDEQESWASPSVASEVSSLALALRFGHRGLHPLADRLTFLDDSAPFLCAQLQI